MKNLLLSLVAILITATTTAQTNTDISPEAAKCLNELKPFAEKAKAVWQSEDGKVTFGTTPERIERYVLYLSNACNIIDKHLSSITNMDEKLDIMWGKVDLLSNILDLYDPTGISISKTEYNQFSSTKIQTLESMLRLSNGISDPIDQAITLYDIFYELGESHFESEKYTEAQLCYSACISKFNAVCTIPNIQNEVDIDVMGQKAYYKMGYVAYKLNDELVAKEYYNKAKALLDDDFIQPYK
ncbi:hypothetical protein [uncultured Rikenella sp.]|uniref:tetratricopeptide repeat protein n=1 Tax=uncultured Rikenella sp. TaxID=368003 RepID=UPI0025DEF40D|nr:hypothetical protein [uncultured Rikenella sp.]